MLESLSLLLAPLTLAAAATTQSPSVVATEADAETTEIVVEAGRERAHVYRRMFSRARLQGYLPRWHQPLCLFQTGIDNQQAREQFAARINTVAESVGAPVAKAGCETNVVVAWTNDGSDLAQLLYRKRPRILTDVTYDAKAAFLRSDAAVRWVPRAELFPPSGAALGSAGEAGIAIAGQAGPAIDAAVFRAEGSSLIREPVSAGMHSMLVIIDVEQAAGVSLEALADHVALIALSGVPMGGREGQLRGDESIMTLFESPASRTLAGLTAADREYLSTLYRINPHKLEWRQRGRLASAVAGALEREAEANEAP